MAVTAARLLAEIDPLSHPAREQTLVRTARQAPPAELSALLDDLFARGPWERRLSLRMAAVVGHLDHVRRCLTGAETSLALAAVGPAVRLGIDAATVVALLPTLPAATRRALGRAVRAGRAGDLADALLGPVRTAHGDREAAALLPACSPDLVVQVLPALAHVVPSWAALARRHPGPFLDHVDHVLDTEPRSSRPAAVVRLQAGLVELARTHPGRVLAVLERIGGRVDLSGGGWARVLAALARHDPSRVLALLLSPARGTSPVPNRRGLWRALSALDDDALVRLARRLSTHELVGLLHALPPARRPAVYLPVLGGRDLWQAGSAYPLLDELPRALRHTETARLLATREAADHRGVRLELTARLPWAQAEPVLREEAAGPQAEDRAGAYRLLVQAAAATRDPAIVEGLVGSLDRLRNEQDPVRSQALRALGAVPTWLLTDASAAGLVRQVDAAVQARDASPTTRAAARRIGDRIIREGAQRGSETLLATGLLALRDAAGHLAHLDLAGLAGGLPRSADPAVLAALRPRLDADARVGRFTVLLALARSLGERAWAVDDLQARIAVACRAKDDAVVTRAVTLWLADPAHRDERVETVLRADASTIALPVVAAAVATRRTDLLDRALGGRQAGRFLRRGVRHVPDVAAHARRWTPRQVALYRDLLRGIVDDPAATPAARTRSLLVLGRVLGALDDVRRHLDDPVDQLADAALTVIAHTDEPGRALPDLVARAAGTRAHVAFAALTRSARFAAPADLAPALLHVLDTGRVTTRKEVCRLLAAYRIDGAVEVLAAELARPAQHRDVRRAAASALRHLLDDERAWVALDRAARTPDVATALLEIGPGQVAPAHRPRLALLVGGVAASDDADVSLAGLSALAAWVRWDGTGELVALAVEVATDVDGASAPAWRAASAAVVAAAVVDDDPAPVLAVADRLLVAHDERDLAEFDAADRDLPARRRLDRLAAAVATAVRRDPETRAVGVVLADRLASRPLLLDVAVRLAVQSVSWDDVDAAATRLGDVVELCDPPAARAIAAQAVGDELARRSASLPPEVLPALAARLAIDPRPAGARVAVVLVAAAAGPLGWTPGLREQLRGLRRHPEPDVRLAAVQVVTGAE